MHAQVDVRTVSSESRISFAAAAAAVDTHDTVAAGDSSVDNKKC